jgi:hypothetical protein
MLAAYHSGDPYLQFAIQAGAAPAGSNKATHGAIREHYKVCSLAMLYGMGPRTLPVAWSNRWQSASSSTRRTNGRTPASGNGWRP